MRTFSQLFVGRTDCYGLYYVKGTGKKKKGDGVTYPNTQNPDARLTKKQWESHLAGDKRLGIVPVRKTGLCSWFAIDIDDYDLDHKKLVKIVEKNNLPLVICKSKSEGAHCYCFINGAIEAEVAIGIGKHWAGEIGYPQAEVFPKQTKPIEIGNWIILPYFGGDDAEDYALGINGERLTLEEFEQIANAKQLLPEEALTFIKKKKPKKKGEITRDNVMLHAPPCIQTAYRDGIGEGGRNKFFFHAGVFWRKVDEHLGSDNWRDELIGLNKHHFNPSMEEREVTSVIKNHNTGAYTHYTCSDEPQCSICDKDTCLTQYFGIGSNQPVYGEVTFDRIIKQDTDPPVWIFVVGERNIRMSTAEVTTSKAFRSKIFEAINILPESVSNVLHDHLIRGLLQTVFTIVDSKDILPGTIIFETFKEWVATSVNMARGREDILKKLPYYDEKNNRVIFRFQDYYNYYKQDQRENMTRSIFASYMKSEGFETIQIKINKVNCAVWSLPIVDKWFEREQF